MNNPSPDTELADLLAELAATTDMSPQAVAAAIEANPTHRMAILRFAVDWHAHEFAGDDEVLEPLPAADLSAYQHGPIFDPFQGKNASELNSTAAACDIPLSLLSKLENRAIIVETIPLLLVRRLATSLATDVSVMLGFLSLRPTLARGVQYRADAPPAAAAQVSFADAVRSTTMGDEQRRRWLTLSE